MTGASYRITSHEDQTGREYFHHSSAQRVNTDIVLIEALRKQYPNLELVVAPQGVLNLLAYAAAGYASYTEITDDKDPIYGTTVKWRAFLPPARRLDGYTGALVDMVLFGKFMYKWNGIEFLLYVANGRDGQGNWPEVQNNYILTTETHKVDQLIRDATIWGSQLHGEVWVFDQGYWSKSPELYDAVRKSTWENVILDEGMKKSIIKDVENFFDNRETYEKLKVPWKRGVIYHGPPGNGKTISIKAMMHELYKRGENGDTRAKVPTLYVRTLSSWAGPEYSIQQIFLKARQEAPCYLVFEDLDSIVTDFVRSYFLNEIDGLKSNDGILIVGSTNHLDRLDPGIAKRPSRFDRKYYFPDPNYDQRVQYSKFWQSKLADNDDIEFPDSLCAAIAGITDKFSFAYMQEAFVAALLAIATREEDAEALKWAGPQDPLAKAKADCSCSSSSSGKASSTTTTADPDLDNLELWKEMQKQVKILREEMGEETSKKAGEQTLKKAKKWDPSSHTFSTLKFRPRQLPPSMPMGTSMNGPPAPPPHVIPPGAAGPGVAERGSGSRKHELDTKFDWEKRVVLPRREGGAPF